MKIKDFSYRRNDKKVQKLLLLSINTKQKMKLDDIDVLILCGGLGTRLRSVIPDQPKGMAPVAGKPFLEILVDDLLKYGFKRFIFCVGHLKDQIIDYFSNRTDGTFLFSEEKTPLGTGGALKNASSLIQSENLLILNGDSLCTVDYKLFYEFHKQRHSVLSMILSVPEDGSEDYGSVIIDSECKLQSFQEKTSSEKRGLINAGIYLMQKEALSFMPEQNVFSLEYDFFPKILEQEHCSGFVIEEKVLDIGPPERYQTANQILE